MPEHVHSGLAHMPAAEAAPAPHLALPGGRKRVFDGHVLVAYYGTAGTGALGVLGDAPPDEIWPRLVRAGRPFATPGHRLQPVFELIVDVATGTPGPDGDFSASIPRAAVREYIRAAHRHGALVILDIQPGRSDFLSKARHWAWALKDPWVGLALDPEWRMGPGQVPATVIGHVRAAEVNRVSAWLSALTIRGHLPQKVFMLHQFRTDMIRGIQHVRPRPGLALVQHVDGFGTPGQKLATYHAVIRPRIFHEGFKLFYRQDVRRMSAKRVLHIRPRVSFVSFQ
ncbi:hypothetical protein [Nocardioides terrisoli]|uniref:hypothetical protein n=1 Tax=Nocardioides terrisoli TaxID=3388267 RepID=UPI00287B87FA|nr:hypothetical protein [Nocardioides marmorisolisilvae]